MQKSEKNYKKEKCETCGHTSDLLMTPTQCNNCKEVEKRLPVYLKSSKGRAFVADALMNATKAAITQAREKKDG